MKKGVGQKCVEGMRKKAKYLLEGKDRGEFNQHCYTEAQADWTRCRYVHPGRQFADDDNT